MHSESMEAPHPFPTPCLCVSSSGCWFLSFIVPFKILVRFEWLPRFIMKKTLCKVLKIQRGIEQSSCHLEVSRYTCDKQDVHMKTYLTITEHMLSYTQWSSIFNECLWKQIFGELPWYSCNLETSVLTLDRSWVEPWLCLALWPWKNYLISLWLNFLIYELR